MLRRFPDHPGANHYYIHAVEASPTPERALASADAARDAGPGRRASRAHAHAHLHAHRRYGWIAPLNARAAEADERYIELAKPDGVYPFMYYGHNLHFVMVGHLATGRYEDSLAEARKMADLAAPHVSEMGPMAEWVVALPLLPDVRFHQWDAILTAPRPPESQTLVRAFDDYARALALTSTGKRDEAVAEAARFESDRARVNDAMVVVSLNSGPKVLAMLSELLKGQMATRHRPTPSPTFAPPSRCRTPSTTTSRRRCTWSVRETLGAVLLTAGRPVDAEIVFREDLVRNPRSGRSLFGLMTSLDAQGRADEAAIVRREFTTAWRRPPAPPVEALY